jgi:hypothetical protein
MRLQGSEICMVGLIPIFHRKLRTAKVPRGTSNGRDALLRVPIQRWGLRLRTGGKPIPTEDRSPGENEAQR